jgi:hypothetical protein
MRIEISESISNFLLFLEQEATTPTVVKNELLNRHLKEAIPHSVAGLSGGILTDRTTHRPKKTHVKTKTRQF